MRKRLMCLIVLAGTLFLSSCFWGGLRTDMLSKMNDHERVDAQLEQVLEAIKNEDKDTLRSMFSQTALDEAVDFENRMDYLFSFFRGEVLSYKRYGFNMSESIRFGLTRKGGHVYYHIITDQQEYYMFFVHTFVDVDHPENVGIYALRLIKAEDREDLRCYYPDMEAGIFEYEHGLD